MKNPEMSNKATKTAIAILVAFVAVFALAVFLIYKFLMMYIPGAWAAIRRGDRTALTDYIQSKNRLSGVIILWVLCALQVFLIVVPLMPVQIIAGMCFGTIGGTLICLSSSVCATMFVFTVASRMSEYINEVVRNIPKLRNWIDSIRNSANRMVFTIIAFLTPGFPNGAIPYAAANAKLDKTTYLKAALIGLPLPTILSCMAGAFAIDGEIGSGIAAIVILFAVDLVLLKNKDFVADRLTKAGIR